MKINDCPVTNKKYVKHAGSAIASILKHKDSVAAIGARHEHNKIRLWKRNVVNMKFSAIITGKLSLKRRTENE